jgi:hypothetical protein
MVLEAAVGAGLASFLLATPQADHGLVIFDGIDYQPSVMTANHSRKSATVRFRIVTDERN